MLIPKISFGTNVRGTIVTELKQPVNFNLNPNEKGGDKLESGSILQSKKDPTKAVLILETDRTSKCYKPYVLSLPIDMKNMKNISTPDHKLIEYYDNDSFTKIGKLDVEFTDIPRFK